MDRRNTEVAKRIDAAKFFLKLNGRLVMKMDVEGSKYELLKHLARTNALKRFDSIFCEFHARKINWGHFKHTMVFTELYLRGSANI